MTLFCKITVPRSKYCLEISEACEKLNFLDNRLIRLKYSESLTAIFGGCVRHITKTTIVVEKMSPKTFGVKTKRPLKFSNESKTISCPRSTGPIRAANTFG